MIDSICEKSCYGNTCECCQWSLSDCDGSHEKHDGYEVDENNDSPSNVELSNAAHRLALAVIPMFDYSCQFSCASLQPELPEY